MAGKGEAMGVIKEEVTPAGLRAAIAEVVIQADIRGGIMVMAVVIREAIHTMVTAIKGEILMAVAITVSVTALLTPTVVPMATAGPMATVVPMVMAVPMDMVGPTPGTAVGTQAGKMPVTGAIDPGTLVGTTGAPTTGPGGAPAPSAGG